MNEIENIKNRYEERKKNLHLPTKGDFYFNWYNVHDRELKFAEIFRNHFGIDFSALKLIEIGAGTGYNLYFFTRIGFALNNIWANELLDDRFETLKSNFPAIHCEAGDATLLNHPEVFDIVFQSTVFTSILDEHFKKNLANTLFKMTKPGGLILWYDFRFDNPRNKHVKGIGKKEVRSLFPDAKTIKFTKLTLAPPIGRRVFKLYNFINFVFPFLRTHVIAEIYK